MEPHWPAAPTPLLQGHPSWAPSEQLQASQADGCLSASSQVVAAGGPESLVTVTVQCAFTLALKVPWGAGLPHLRTLLSQALPLQAQHGQLR